MRRRRLAAGGACLITLAWPGGGDAQVPNRDAAPASYPIEVNWVGIKPERVSIDDNLSPRDLRPVGNSYRGRVHFGRNPKIPDSIYVDYGAFGLFRLPIRAPREKRSVIPLQIDVRILYKFCNPGRVDEVTKSSTAPLIAMRRLVQGRLLASIKEYECGKADMKRLVRGLAGHNSFLSQRWDFVAVDSELMVRPNLNKKAPTPGARRPSVVIANVAHQTSKPTLGNSAAALPATSRRTRPKN